MSDKIVDRRLLVHAADVYRLEEVLVALVVVFEGPALTQEKYEESVRRLTGGKSRVESPEDWPVEGLLAHIAGEGEHGFRVVDVWDSEDPSAASARS